MSNGNSLNISNTKMFLNQMVMGNVNSWIRKKVLLLLRGILFDTYNVVLENIRKYRLIILKLCRLNENSSLSSVYYQSS